MILDVRAAAGFLQPLLHLLVGRLADERLLDAVAIVVDRWRLAGMRLHRDPARMCSLKYLRISSLADLDAGPEAHIDEAHQHQLPQSAGPSIRLR